jgi:hypothetical protein
VGKQMFMARENTDENHRRIESALTVLQNYRDRWYTKLLQAERLNLRKETMPARDYKSFVHLSKDTEELHHNEQKVAPAPPPRLFSLSPPLSLTSNQPPFLTSLLFT